MATVWAKVRDGQVVETMRGADDAPPGPDYKQLMDVKPALLPYQYYGDPIVIIGADYVERTYPALDMPLTNQLRIAVGKQIEKEALARIVAGTQVYGYPVNTRPNDIIELATLHALANGGQWASGRGYLFADNVYRELNESQMQIVYRDVCLYILGIRQRQGELYQQIRDAKTVAELRWVW